MLAYCTGKHNSYFYLFLAIFDDDVLHLIFA